MNQEYQYQPRKAWGIASMLCGLQTVNFLDKVVIGLVAVPMMKELELTPLQFGVVAGSVFWLFSVGGVLGGMLANRIQSRYLLLGMAILWSLAQIPIAVSSSLVVLVIARALLGFGEGPSAAIALHAVFKWFPNHKRNLPSALINAGSALGVILAGLIISFITTHWGWRANFWALAGLGVIWSVVWLIYGAEGSLDANTPDVSKTATPDRVPYMRLLTDPTILGVFVMHFVAYWMVALTLTWLPPYLQNGLGFAAEQSGVTFSLIVLFSLPVTFLVLGFSQRRLTRGASSRRGRVLIACCALVVAGALFASMRFIQYSALQEIMVVTLATGLVSANFSFAQALVGEVAPASQRGAVLGIEHAIFGSLAGVLAPMVMGWLIQDAANPLASYHQGFAVSGLLLMLGGLCCFMLMNPERSSNRLAGGPQRRQVAGT